MTDLDIPRLRSAYETARDLLLAECRSDGDGPVHWTGELSTSALSTATAVMALQMVRQGGRDASDYGIGGSFDALIRGGLDWLNSHQNEDGGWGDTVKSLSNISTTMLAHAVFHATGTADDEAFRETVAKAKQYIDDAGGVPAVVKRYGKDKTFSVPILTHCALAGLVDWGKITPLPFELSCVPARFYAAVKMPVVSYALPALIAIGQVRYHFRPTWNPITRVLRRLAIRPSLRVLERIQPPNGGFLEAAPLTSFVTMSLAGMGLVDHVVVQRAVRFLAESVRPDGSWPIDTNLATWTTTLSINALKDDVPDELVDGLADWLLGQQYKETHPYTNAAPGGWAWTNLPGGVPDADDTPGAVLALQQLQANAERCRETRSRSLSPESGDVSRAADGFGGEGRGEGVLETGPLTPTLSQAIESHDESKPLAGEREPGQTPDGNGLPSPHQNVVERSNDTRSRSLSPESGDVSRAEDGFGGEGRGEGALETVPLTPTLSHAIESHDESKPLAGEREPGQTPDGNALLECRPDQAPRRSGKDAPDATNALPERRRAWSGLQEAQHNAVRWLLDLQNRDGGFPTFCRGWGTLPFDRSSPDITAHCLRGILVATPEAGRLKRFFGDRGQYLVKLRIERGAPIREAQSLSKGLGFLKRAQRPDGSWLPLWFGNQYGHDDGNPVYGTSRVLMAYRDLGLMDAPEAQRAAAWLAAVQEGGERANQNSPAPCVTGSASESPGAGTGRASGTRQPVQALPARSSRPSPREGEEAGSNDGGPREARPTLRDADSSLGSQPSALSPPRGWGGDAGIAPSVEETALAAEVLLDYPAFRENAFGGIRWLIERVEDGSVCEPSPIGFYFARLWYFESLYPLIFAVSALRRALEIADPPTEP